VSATSPLPFSRQLREKAAWCFVIGKPQKVLHSGLVSVSPQKFKYCSKISQKFKKQAGQIFLCFLHRDRLERPEETALLFSKLCVESLAELRKAAAGT